MPGDGVILAATGEEVASTPVLVATGLTKLFSGVRALDRVGFAIAPGEIKRIWSDLGARGHAILLASTDAEELVDTCDRVVVMSHGRSVGALERGELSERALLRMAIDG